MLVLSRKMGEKIMIADNVVVTVCAVRGDKVRIGIEAPPEVKVMRSELLGPRKELPRVIPERGPDVQKTFVPQ